MKQARPYQNKAIRETTEAFKGVKSVCLQSPTGSGKTYIAGKIAMDLHAQLAGRRGGIALFLVHRKELINQAVKTLTEVGLGDQVGIIASGVPETPWAPIQVASVFTLARRLDAVRSWFRPKIVFIDEAHHVRAETWERILHDYKDAYRLGLTATPARLDGKGLGKYFDRLVLGPSIKHLMEIGALCNLKNYSVNVGLDMAGVPKQMGKYNIKETDKRITGQVIASSIDNFLHLCTDKRVLFFGNNIRHSMEFIAKVKAAGYRAEHVDGDTPGPIRDGIFERFYTGETQVLGNVAIATEGYDCPECDCVILGYKTASMTLYKQMVGRAMRIKGDGRDGMIVDLAGNMDDHGDPEDDVDWTLDDGVIRPEQTSMYAPDGNRTCKGCGYRYPRKQFDCPMCGEDNSVPAPIEVDALVEERKGKNGKEPKLNRSQLNSMVFKTMGDDTKLREIQQTYGYKPGVIRQWKRIFGKSWGMVGRLR